MTSAPLNVYTAGTANKAPKVRVFLGPDDGSNDDDFQETFDLVPIEVLLTAGSQPDYATFEYKTDTIVEHKEAALTMTRHDGDPYFGRQVYIAVEDATGQTVADPVTGNLSPLRRVIFWGELLKETLSIDPQTQKITISARVADYHFGDPLEGELHYDPLTDDFQTVPVDPVFNPLIDGIIEPNMTDSAITPDDPADTLTAGQAQGWNSAEDHIQNMRYYWIEPEAVRTFAARQLIGAAIDSSAEDPSTGQWPLKPPVPWTLLTISKSLENWLLAEGEFLSTPGSNPDLDDLADVKNLAVNRGLHLNKLLDEILAPYGADWYLDHSPFDPAVIDPARPYEGKAAIKYFRRGLGAFRQVFLQEAGEELDLGGSNADHIDVATDIGNLATQIRGWGSFEQKELTIPLYRGWIEEQDDLTAEELRKSDPDSDYSQSPHVRNAWRLFVANEAGDWTGLRTSVEPIEEVLDLSSVFERYIPGRRVADDCLTLGQDGKRRPPLLEWHNGNEWAEAPPDWGWVLLGDQIGIRFENDVPPEDLIAAGDNARLRITCTLTGDARLYAEIDDDDGESPSARTVPLVLDLSDRFHKRSVETSGDYASVLAGHPADEADDLAEIREFVTEALAQEIAAEMKCEFRLHGIHLEYEISDLIIDVSGRDIYLNRHKEFSEKFVQVFGIRWLFQEQVTQLIVEDIDV